jgi:hypothetical protein
MVGSRFKAGGAEDREKKAQHPGDRVLHPYCFFIIDV